MPASAICFCPVRLLVMTPSSKMVDQVAELDPNAGIRLFELSALRCRLCELVGSPVDLLPEPVEKLRLRASTKQDRVRAFP